MTRAVERNPLTLIRIAALGLTDPAHQGEALSGLVAAAELGQQRLALRASRRIRDIAARARLRRNRKSLPADTFQKVAPKKESENQEEPAPIFGTDNETTAKKPSEDGAAKDGKGDPRSTPANPKVDGTPAPEGAPKPLTPQTN